MKVRLAFAVAAHLEPEILIIDEVLAVGDAEFPAKCLGKMQDVAQGGRTVLFVSHNMGGRVSFLGSIDDAVTKYLHSLRKQASQAIAARTDRRGSGPIRLTNVKVSMGPDHPANLLATGQPATFTFDVTEFHPNANVYFTIHDERGFPVSLVTNWPRSERDIYDVCSKKQILCQIDELPLRAGRYFINVWVNSNREMNDEVEAAVFFDVENCDYRGRSFPHAYMPGVVCLDYHWNMPR
jgi:lipopolysaccharide transport system ATP-binding protein